MIISHPSSAPDYFSNAGVIRSGALDIKVLAVGKEGTLGAYRVGLEETPDEGWTTPRHRHNLDQLRLQLEGDMIYAHNKTLKQGMVAYFPESIHYGPQQRLPHSLTLNIQFSGASRNGFMTPKQRGEGHQRLSEKGTFGKNGIYSWVDEGGKNHNQDAYEAIWEEINGRKLIYAAPRYESIVRMYPDHFEWTELSQSPGVAQKLVGVFTENDLRVSFVKITPGVSFSVLERGAPQLIFVLSGSVLFDGTAYGQYTAFGIEDEDCPCEFGAETESVVYFVQLPVFSGVENVVAGVGTS